MVRFSEFLKTWSVRSNRVTRQVSFNRSKFGGKCQNSKVQMRHFEEFSNIVQVPDKHIRLSLAPHVRDPNERRFFKCTVSLFNGKYLLHVSARQRLIVWKNHWVIFGVGLVTSFFHPLSVSWNFWTIPTNIKAWKEEKRIYVLCQIIEKLIICIHLPIHIHFWTSINYPIGQFFSAASAYSIMNYLDTNAKSLILKKALFTYTNNYSTSISGQ